MKTVRIFTPLTITLFVITWIFLCVNNINLALKISGTGFGPVDVAKRVTSPDGSKTAILARSYVALDMNFSLYVTNKSMVDIRAPSKEAIFYLADGQTSNMAEDTRGYIWLSHDYDPSTHHNWKEDLVWSKDSSVIAVLIKDEFAFAYDFSTLKSYDDGQEIIDLLKAH